MSDVMGLVYSDTSVSSTDGEISFNRHTRCVHFINLHASTNAVVRVNGGPHEILIPAGKNYVELEGDYTKFQVITAGVNIAVFALG